MNLRAKAAFITTAFLLTAATMDCFTTSNAEQKAVSQSASQKPLEQHATTPESIEQDSAEARMYRMVVEDFNIATPGCRYRRGQMLSLHSPMVDALLQRIQEDDQSFAHDLGYIIDVKDAIHETADGFQFELVSAGPGELQIRAWYSDVHVKTPLTVGDYNVSAVGAFVLTPAEQHLVENQWLTEREIKACELEPGGAWLEFSHVVGNVEVAKLRGVP